MPKAISLERSPFHFSTRGLAFVEMIQAADARAAIPCVNGVLLNERALRVNEARPKLQPDPARVVGDRRSYVIRLDVRVALSPFIWLLLK